MRLSKRNAPERRAPFEETAAKLTSPPLGRTTTRQTPLSIRSKGVELDEDEREHIRVRLGFKLGKFATRIGRIVVRVVDESGPTGAPLIACRVDVSLDPVRDVFMEQRHPTLRGAIDLAVDRTERAVRRALQKDRALKS